MSEHKPGEDRYANAKRRIPGGTQLLSKRPEMMAPGRWPAYYTRAVGCETWDLDGRRFVDMSTNGIGSCLLGFAHPRVTEAVVSRVRSGSMCSLNPPEEVELADRLCELHPWAEQVRFTRGGGESCAVAVRIARATTGRSKVAVCGYHGWHDWYLACNLGERDALRGHLLPGLEPSGVPGELRGTAFTFAYNDTAAFDSIVSAHGGDLAAIVMEPCRHHVPEPGFLDHVREAATRTGAVLIFDEITIGWRLCFGGAHRILGVDPDIAVFAKALGNGHPIGAIIGTTSAMDGAHHSFISSTYWTEGVGPAAALATLREMAEYDVPTRVASVGAQVADVWRDIATHEGLPVRVDNGHPCLAHFTFEHRKAEVLRTLYTRFMLDEGYLAGPSLYPTVAHTDEVIRGFSGAVESVFRRLRLTLDNDLELSLPEAEVAHSGFRRLV